MILFLTVFLLLSLSANVRGCGRPCTSGDCCDRGGCGCVEKDGTDVGCTAECPKEPTTQCEWSTWIAGECNCDGLQTFTREVTKPPTNDGSCEGNDQKVELCTANVKLCPVEGCKTYGTNGLCSVCEENYDTVTHACLPEILCPARVWCSHKAGCKEDVHKCPDGTTVSRQGPDCEFSSCPRQTRKGKKVAEHEGTCPVSTGFGTCDEACESDADCKVTQKCCSNNCGRKCQESVKECKGSCLSSKHATARSRNNNINVRAGASDGTEESSDSKTSPTADSSTRAIAIAAVVVGSVGFLILIIFVIFVLMYKD